MPFRRSRGVDIQPGQAFHLPASQEKNMANLIKVLGTKQATEALTELARTTPDTWADIKESTSNLNKFMELGGAAVIIEGFKETIDLQIQDALSPLTNEINQLLADALAPFDEMLNNIFNELGQFVAENAKGALVGAIGGQIASMFLPGGPILIAIGAIVGAALEDRLRDIIEAETPREAIELSLPLAVPGLPGVGAGLGLNWILSLFGF